MLIDTHCHLADPAYEADRAEVMARAWAAGVARIVVIGESRGSTERALEMAAAEPRLSVTGVHPHAAGWSDGPRLARAALNRPGEAAGEMSLDYHYDHSPRDVRAALSPAVLARERANPR
jgi:TatD DNase family protein